MHRRILSLLLLSTGLNEPDAARANLMNDRSVCRTTGWAAALLAAVVIAACGRGERRETGTTTDQSNGGDRRIVVYNAGSLALPLRTALDSFAAREHVTVDQENAGSLETARKLTELGKIPDIVAVADYEVIPLLLIPSHATWYVKFARNRMVLAYEDRSHGAAEINTNNWWQIVTRPGVQVGRADQASTRTAIARCSCGSWPSVLQAAGARAASAGDRAGEKR
jgi:ABC-type molybdate transport system substrate-binding protein